MAEKWYDRGLLTVSITSINFLTILSSPGKSEMRMTVQQHLWLRNYRKKDIESHVNSLSSQVSPFPFTVSPFAFFEI